LPFPERSGAEQRTDQLFFLRQQLEMLPEVVDEALTGHLADRIASKNRYNQVFQGQKPAGNLSVPPGCAAVQEVEPVHFFSMKARGPLSCNSHYSPIQ